MTIETWVKRSGLWKKMNTGTTTGGGENLPTIPTISYNKFRGYWGTRIFPTYTGKTGGELVQNHSWITNLGPKFVTHKLEPGLDAGTIQLIQDLAAEGTKSVLTVGAPFTTYTNTQWNNMMSVIQNDLAGCLLMVTGQNEVNHDRGTGTRPADWATQAANHQQQLWTRMQTVNSALVAAGHPAVLVGSCCLWSGNISTHDADLNTLAPMISGYINAIVYHLYPRGGHPTWNLDAFIANYKSKFGSNLPVWCTESGYFAAANYTGGAQVVSEYAHNIYLKKMWLEYAKRGAYIGQFELLNDPDASESNREANFGLIRTPSVSYTTWTARPAYTSIQTMQNKTGGTDGTIGCEINAGGPIQYLAVNHSTGTILYIWRTDDIEVNRVKINLTPYSVTIKSTAGGTQTVNVSDDVVAVNI